MKDWKCITQELSHDPARGCYSGFKILKSRWAGPVKRALWLHPAIINVMINWMHHSDVVEACVIKLFSRFSQKHSGIVFSHVVFCCARLFLVEVTAVKEKAVCKKLDRTNWKMIQASARRQHIQQQAIKQWNEGCKVQYTLCASLGILQNTHVQSLTFMLTALYLSDSMSTERLHHSGLFSKEISSLKAAIITDGV